MSEKSDKVDNIVKNIYSLLQNDIKKNDDKPNDSFDKINSIYTIISNKLDEINKNKEQNYKSEFSKNFEELKNKQIEQINNSLKENEPNYIYITKSLNSQMILYNYLNEIFLEKYLNFKDEEIYNIIRSITKSIISNYNNLANITLKLMDNFEIMNEEINNLNMEINNKDKYLRQLNDKIIILKEKLIKNEQENELISIKLINNNINNKIIEPFNKNIKLRNRNFYSKNLVKTKSLTSLTSKSDKLYLNNKIVPQKNIFYRNNGDNIINNANLTNSFLTGNRIFTKKMLKDIIYNIYNSKNNFNNKCIENKLPKETMEEYMYTYFNYKYGLKNMVIEWATIIINGIKTYSYIDNEICLFGKILRNDLDESCQYIMPKIKKNLEETIIKIFKKEYGLKSNEEIIEYKNKLIKNRLPLNIVQLILDNNYTKDEQEKLLPKITELVNEFKNRTVNNEFGDNISFNLNSINNKENRFYNKLSRIELNQKLLEKENELNSISFDELVNIFHELEINKKENYVRPFVYAFKKIDEDSDGIINENQFINLVKDLNILEEKNFDNLLNELLNLIDPYGYKKFIFTDCVEVFSSYNIRNKNIFDIINSKEKEGIDNGKKNL
jgi:hypothetical protein